MKDIDSHTEAWARSPRGYLHFVGGLFLVFGGPAAAVIYFNYTPGGPLSLLEMVLIASGALVALLTPGWLIGCLIHRRDPEHRSYITRLLLKRR